ncbi:SRBD1 [Bugula neritina]|uniref:SRBD1 n=1 Tax=Bugula neritina TaxID=10212 RepID=A0A7J7J4T8_BUGNE|nr:SRBD1 [Bugula neritina]
MSSTLWTVEQALSDQVNLDRNICENLVNLIEKEQCTLPFIARYRKNETKNIALDKLRQVFESLSQLRDIQKKIDSSINKIEKTGNLTGDIKSALRGAQTLEEVEFISAPFKNTGGKRTLAGKACELGLDKSAEQILNGERVNLNIQVKDEKGKLLSVKEVEQGIKYVLADVLSKDTEILAAIRTQFKKCGARIVTSRKVSKGESTTSKKETKTSKAASATSKSVKGDKGRPKKDESHKYEQYFNFSVGVSSVRPHQTLAINRGESHKYLSVKLDVPDSFQKFYCNACARRWPAFYKSYRRLFDDVTEDSYKRLLIPMLTRQCRSELKQVAEWSSIDTFGSNLKGLLLQPPCRGETILGVDPGYTNGCKMAVISPSDSATLYLHNHVKKAKEIVKLADLVQRNKCGVIALGNQTACRDTEAIISDCIGKGVFAPLPVKYCIVNEDGSSVYSVSKLAEEELPQLDQNLRSAVSIARRLQNPLMELVKIEPQHIGVGMYQHDIAEAKLSTRLDSVLSECVSFVGVEINSASEHILSRVSGLNKTKAKAILSERERVGGQFICREQLLNVKGLGTKSYEQCAGFITVKPLSNSKGSVLTTPKGATRKKKAKLLYSANPLDQTMIHPSSYELAERFLKKLNLVVDDVGTIDLINKVKKWAQGMLLTPYLSS